MDERQLAFRRIVLRVVAVLGLVAMMTLLPATIEDPGLKALVPYFSILIFLHFGPMFWAGKVDLFAPPVVFGILGGVGALSTGAGMMVAGNVRLDLTHGLNSDQMGALAERVLLASIVGILSYYAGYYLNAARGFRRKFPDVAGLEWNWGRIRLVAALTFVLFLIAYSVFQRRVGGSLLDPTMLGAGKQVWRNDPTMSWMMRGVQLGFLPPLLYVSWSASQKGWRHFGLAMAAVGLMGLLVLRLGQRGTPGAVLLNMLIIVHYLRRRVPAAAFLGMLFGVLLLSNILLIYRTNPDQAADQTSTSLTDVKVITVLANTEAERQRFSVMALVMKEFPENRPYLLGESWLALMATPIPRWIWPEKGQHFMWRDTAMAAQLGGGPQPTPFVSVLYANFSWIGIVLGMFLWGTFHRALYEWVRAHSRDVNVVLMYSLILVHFGPTLLQISSAIQYVLPVWLMLWFVGKRPVGKRPIGKRPVGERPAAAPAHDAATATVS